MAAWDIDKYFPLLGRVLNLPSGTTIAGSAVTALGTISSTSANALVAGPNGTTNPAFNVDASASSAATGINVAAAAAGSGVTVSSSSSGANENLTISPKGTGLLFLDSVVEINTPVAINATATATAAQVASGYITSTSAAATTITLPTGTLLGTALGAAQGTILELYIDNTAGANTVTLAVAVNGIKSDAANTTAASFGQLTVANGVTGQGRFTLMFSSATAYTFTRTA
jgi:hypothetical protein